MASTEVINGVKEAVGLSLAGPAGEVCMQTRCQDIIPRQCSKPCRTEAHGQNARLQCRPILAECQNDAVVRASCVNKCTQFFDGSMADQCVKDCSRAHCRKLPAYDRCVLAQTVRDILTCMQQGDGRGIAEHCLQQRCGLASFKNALASRSKQQSSTPH